MTWPPGDARGYWSALFDFYGHLIDDGHHLNLPDPTTLHHATQLAKEPPKILTEQEQQIVADTIGEVLRTQMAPRRSLPPRSSARTFTFSSVDSMSQSTASLADSRGARVLK